jgi:hypothetical protein
MNKENRRAMESTNGHPQSLIIHNSDKINNLPYIQWATDRIENVLKRKEVKTYFKHMETIK